MYARIVLKCGNFSKPAGHLLLTFGVQCIVLLLKTLLKKNVSCKSILFLILSALPEFDFYQHVCLGQCNTHPLKQEEVCMSGKCRICLQCIRKRPANFELRELYCVSYVFLTVYGHVDIQNVALLTSPILRPLPDIPSTLSVVLINS